MKLSQPRKVRLVILGNWSARMWTIYIKCPFLSPRKQREYFSMKKIFYDVLK